MVGGSTSETRDVGLAAPGEAGAGGSRGRHQAWLDGQMVVASARVRPSARERSGLVAFVVCLVLGLVVFHGLGHGELAPPPLAPGGWRSWAAERDALVATVALLRLVVLALLWYLVGATSVGLVARLARAVRLVRVADALTVPFVRRLLRVGLGVTLATAVVTAATVPSGVRGAPVDGAAVVALAAAAPDPSAVAPDPSAAAPLPPPLRLLERSVRVPEVQSPAVSDATPDGAGSDGRSSVEGVDRATAGPGRLDDALGPPGPSGMDGEVVVAPGDSFWSIARDALVAAGEPAPDEPQVAAYWQRLVAANRDRLVVSDEPDLLYPGQALVLPDPTSSAPPGSARSDGAEVAGSAAGPEVRP